MNIDTINILKVLSDPIRLSLVKRLSQTSELCVCRLEQEYGISQPTLSFHMKKLTQSGLVLGRKDGKWVQYSLNRSTYDQLKKELEF